MFELYCRGLQRNDHKRTKQPQVIYQYHVCTTGVQYVLLPFYNVSLIIFENYGHIQQSPHQIITIHNEVQITATVHLNELYQVKNCYTNSAYSEDSDQTAQIRTIFTVCMYYW